jgi:hypothetical protein
MRIVPLEIVEKISLMTTIRICMAIGVNTYE